MLDDSKEDVSIFDEYISQQTKATGLGKKLEKDTPEYHELLGEHKSQNKRHTYMSEDGKFIYYVGVIDYLQDYNIRKKGENFFKTLFAPSKDKDYISAVHPPLYRNRYHDFMQNHVITNQF